MTFLSKMFHCLLKNKKNVLMSNVRNFQLFKYNQQCTYYSTMFSTKYSINYCCEHFHAFNYGKTNYESLSLIYYSIICYIERFLVQLRYTN